MAYAEVSVNSPVAGRRTFSYSIPPGLRVEAGQAVWVPFGSRLLQGIVVELTERPAVAETRDIAEVIGPAPVLSPAQLSLARWISDYYLSPLFDALALMLPPGFERKTLTFLSLPPPTANVEPPPLTLFQRQALALVGKRGRVDSREIEKALGKKKAQDVITQLVRRGLLLRSYQPEPLKVRPRVETRVRLAVTPAQAREAAARAGRARQQATVLEFLAGQAGPVPLAVIRARLKCTRTAIEALAARGLVTLDTVEVTREAFDFRGVNPSQPLALTGAQRRALDAIMSALRRETPGRPSVFLLHGVTGSGKTEVYLQALAGALRMGRRGVVLVPEIALTPQTVERFAARFPGRVAVLHSHLTLGEQFDEWRRIREGGFDVVVGPRSALFAPQPDLGLIILDEEHEWNYKQEEQAPRYHAREAAVRLARTCGAAVVLGSATPDVETYYRAQAGEYTLLTLTERVTPVESAPMPAVEVVDMRAELRTGNRSLFSRSLTEAITSAVRDQEQVILFLNRRGSASFVQCRKCGFALRCPRCDLALTHHLPADILVCHQCNYKIRTPAVCPRCSSPHIKFLGVGTQKVEQEAGRTFAGARLLRWDSDATRGRHSHEEIMTSFRGHQADILIGTQMVAKGLDLPLVTLVGVINADLGLNLPDFRAGERTFQLLSQVAGRAGRGERGGRVFIQTYSPEHYAIEAAAAHDYRPFYERELAFRRALRNPPFARLALLVYSHTNDGLCQRAAERLQKQLIEERDGAGLDVGIIGPAPAYVRRLRGRFRWQIVLRAADPTALLARVPLPPGWTVDIDPASLL